MSLPLHFALGGLQPALREIKSIACGHKAGYKQFKSHREVTWLRLMKRLILKPEKPACTPHICTPVHFINVILISRTFFINTIKEPPSAMT